MGRTLLVGLGSPHGDDQAGWLVADRLAEVRSAAGSSPQWSVRLARVPLDLLDWLEGVDRLIIIDACQALGEPGRLHRWTWPDPAIADCRSLTSHDFGLSSVLQMAGALGTLPREVIVWGIEIADCEPRQEPSPELQTAVARAAADVSASLI